MTGGFLLEHFWWGSVFLVNVPFVVLGLPLLLWLIPESRDPEPKRLDPIGVLLSVVGLTALIYGIIEGGKNGAWGTTEVLGSLSGGIALIALFIWTQRRPGASLDLSLFRKPAFSAGTAAVAITFFALMGLMFVLTFYLQAVRGYDPLEAGAYMIPLSLGLLLVAPRAAAIVRRVGAKAAVTTGMLTVAIGTGSFMWVESDTSMWPVEVLLFVMGIGMGAVIAPATEAVMGTIPREKAGAGSAVNNTVRMVGGALGVAIMGSVLSASYREGIGDEVAILPSGQEEARESIGGTFAAAEELVKAIRQGRLPMEGLGGVSHLLNTARDAFVDSMHNVALWTMVVCGIGALVALLFLPGRESVARGVNTDTTSDRVPTPTR